MNCIICKEDSSNSRSKEHIIPESLGNDEHVLPRGIVCDACNNYLAREVEKPLLDTTYFREMRYRARIRTKSRHPPSILGVHLQSMLPVNLYASVGDHPASIAAAHPEDEIRWIRSVRAAKRGTLIVPVSTKPEDRLVSRFLCKVAIEALALRLLDIPGGIREIVDKKELDPLRTYVRRGQPPGPWIYHERPLYALDHVFYESGYGSYEVLHEWRFVYTQHEQLYLVLALFGVEYAINLAGPEIEGYKSWLAEHGGRSPLYPDAIANTELRDQAKHQ